MIKKGKNMTKNPYIQSDGPPKMVPSFVCYADILGYSQLSKEALRSGKGAQFLNRLRHALSGGYERVRENSTTNVIKGLESFSIKVFTDNIVVGYPLYTHHGEPELGDVFGIFAELQTGLAMEGFFLRGGIAFGEHYMDEDIVFGDAFLQAVELDKGGGAPRISLAPSAIEVVKKHLGFYGKDYWAPQFEDLLIDVDGNMFLNYLGQAFCAFPEGGVFFDVIEGHQRNVTEGLQIYRGSPGIRAKFEWSARYHNFICRDFAERHPIPTSENADPEYGSAAAEAQNLLNYIIDVESFAATPSRISNNGPIRVG